VQRIVHRHRAESGPKGWSTGARAFYFAFPESASGGFALIKMILHVEDNTSDEKLTMLAFKKCGIANEVIVMGDGAAARDFFETGAHASRDARALPTLVLLDLKLPKADGLEVLRRVRADERTNLLPVVVLTASKEEADVLNSYSLGARSHVRKPVEFAEFPEAAKTWGLFWLLLNEGAPAPRGTS